MNHIEYRKLISTTIANIRFPLLATVIICHCSLGDTGFEAADNFQHLISYIFTRSTVRLFFIMSGFLYFWNIQKMDWNIYKSKSISRFRTLVIPYIFWNTFMIACYAAMHTFTPNLINPENENVLQYNWTDWILAYWNKSGGDPVCYPLWFLRDLIVLVFLSPILYLFIKTGKILRWLILFVIIIATDVFMINGGLSLLYFYLGALLSQKDSEDFLLERIINPYCNPTSKKYKNILKIILAVIVVVYSISVYKLYLYATPEIWESIHRGTATVLLILLAVYLTRKHGIIGKKIAETGYFIYLFHAFPVFCVKKLSLMVINPSSSFGWIMLYLGIISFIMLFCIYTYQILNHFFPNFIAWTTGGKIKK